MAKWTSQSPEICASQMDVPSGGPGGGRPPGLSPKSLNILLLLHFILMPRLLLHMFCVFVYYMFAVLFCCKVFSWMLTVLRCCFFVM